VSSIDAGVHRIVALLQYRNFAQNIFRVLRLLGRRTISLSNIDFRLFESATVFLSTKMKVLSKSRPLLGRGQINHAGCVIVHS
jgi:hypothetical protein